MFGIIYSDTKEMEVGFPDYHRLDVSLSKKFKFTKYTGLEANLSVTNAYNRPNIFTSISKLRKSESIACITNIKR